MRKIEVTHRDKTGEISRKHGNTQIQTLRRVYGEDFAKGKRSDLKLSDVLQELDHTSLSRLLRDYEAHKLDAIVPVDPWPRKIKK
jgi:hypothetical protein